jgi:hypothetical protein
LINTPESWITTSEFEMWTQSVKELFITSLQVKVWADSVT